MANLTAQPGRPAPARRVRAVPPAKRRSGLPGTLRSEFTKLRSVRSTYLTLAAFVVAGLGAAIAGSASGRSTAGQASFDATATSLQTIVYDAALILVMIGVLMITSEYGTRMIGTSLAAMPRRGVLYAAKAVVLACVTLAVALVTSFTSFFAGQAILGPAHAGASITSPGALRAVLLIAVFVTCWALVAFGLGAVIRYSAGAIAALFGLFFILPLLAGLLPRGWGNATAPWVPGNSTLYQIVATKPTGKNLFGPDAEVAVFAGYAVIALVVGALLFLRRDA